MSIFKRTQGHVITTNLKVCPDVVKSSEFKIDNVIKHLLAEEKNFAATNPIYKELLDVCIETLTPCKDDLVYTGDTSLPMRSGLRTRSFFYPSCRIIQVNLINTSRASRTSVRRTSVIEEENGYNMSVPKWAHSVLVIKIERMTDVSCFASWSLIN